MYHFYLHSPDDAVDFFIRDCREEGAYITDRADISPSLFRLRIDSPDTTPLAFRPIDVSIVPPQQKKSQLSSLLEASGYSSVDSSMSSLQPSLVVSHCLDANGPHITGPSPISVIPSGPSPCLLRPLEYRETERFFPHCSERSAPIAIPWQKPTPQHADKQHSFRHQPNSF